MHNSQQCIVQNIKKSIVSMKKAIKYGLRNIILFGLILTTFSCEQKRLKDIDEIVLAEYVFEKNGIYYKGDCETHAKNKFTGECKFYHDNSKLKGYVQIENGLPTGHWKYWDSTGLNILDLYFEKGNLIKKNKPEREPDFPWIKKVTKISIEAILNSIQNIKNDSSYQGNFPTDIYNMPFTWMEESDFEIVGYETSSNVPEILKIHFHPINENMSILGPRFTVEIDIINEQAVKVYMTPDA